MLSQVAEAYILVRASGYAGGTSIFATGSKPLVHGALHLTKRTNSKIHIFHGGKNNFHGGEHHKKYS